MLDDRGFHSRCAYWIFLLT